jgi:hypothetical protein
MAKKAIFPGKFVKTQDFRREELPAKRGGEFICATWTQTQYRRAVRWRYCMIDNVLVAASFGFLFFGITCRGVQYFHAKAKKAREKFAN